MGSIAGVVVLALGGLVSVLTFVHDVVRLGLPPQGAPKRVPPEVHFLASLLTGTGAFLRWSWMAGGLVFVGHLLVAYLVLRPLIDRFAPSGSQDF